jgi:hypothetical protein
LLCYAIVAIGFETSVGWLPDGNAPFQFDFEKGWRLNMLSTLNTVPTNENKLHSQKHAM